ncbi:MAG: DUF2958 domain-containing protein [Mesorhizobium sp.]|nr:MAG: DUF2958 domain-containing protein [Mesorhizobium sp.]
MDLAKSFQIHDLGMGCPELGYVALSDLDSLRGPLWQPHRLRHDLCRQQANFGLCRLRSPSRFHRRVMERGLGLRHID